MRFFLNDTIFIIYEIKFFLNDSKYIFIIWEPLKRPRPKGLAFSFTRPDENSFAFLTFPTRLRHADIGNSSYRPKEMRARCTHINACNTYTIIYIIIYTHYMCACLPVKDNVAVAESFTKTQHIIIYYYLTYLHYIS